MAMQGFRAFEVQPSKEYKMSLGDNCVFHLSTASIPHGGKGHGTLYVTVDGKSFAIATFDSSKNLLHSSTDLIFNDKQSVVFRVKGGTSVHCCGYEQQVESDVFADQESSDGSEDGGLSKRHGNDLKTATSRVSRSVDDQQEDPTAVSAQDMDYDDMEEEEMEEEEMEEEMEEEEMEEEEMEEEDVSERENSNVASVVKPVQKGSESRNSGNSQRHIPEGHERHGQTKRSDFQSHSGKKRARQ
ncbi:hypothetical protein ERJ75_000755500 [Trypanosoma vivax]|nr:hypothetical protein ERJ75_000755500 [Trypanosoma vivax]